MCCFRVEHLPNIADNASEKIPGQVVEHLEHLFGAGWHGKHETCKALMSKITLLEAVGDTIGGPAWRADALLCSDAQRGCRRVACQARRVVLSRQTRVRVPFMLRGMLRPWREG